MYVTWLCMSSYFAALSLSLGAAERPLVFDGLATRHRQHSIPHYGL